MADFRKFMTDDDNFVTVDTVNGTAIRQSLTTGHYYTVNPSSGVLRIFGKLYMAVNYLKNYEVLESHAKAMRD